MSLARLRALVVLAVLAVAAIVTIGWAIAQDGEHDKDRADDCQVKAALTVPQPSQVKVRILNATDRDGLATEVGDALAARGFTIVGVGNAPTVIEGPAEVHYGPLAAGSAKLVRAQIDKATARPERREDDVVELVIGPDFTELASTTQADKNLKNLGKPPLPSTTCSP